MNIIENIEQDLKTIDKQIDIVDRHCTISGTAELIAELIKTKAELYKVVSFENKKFYSSF